MEITLAFHVIFGLLGTLAGMWVFVEALNASRENRKRMFTVGLASAVFIWLSFIFGGYWYVNFYWADRDIILAGHMPRAHSFFMEAKEHLFFVLLLLATYLPIILNNRKLYEEKGTRALVLTITGLMVLLGLIMERFGSIVSYGVTVGLRK
ncbi:MAG: hypothetical protein ACYC27_12435 [Armatimonadota bacterium]